VKEVSQHEGPADELLALRCQLGERAAFDELIRRWSEPLRRHALRVTGNEDAANELVQDIWLRVVQGIGRLRECAKFRAWLFGIAHRSLMDRFRQRYAAPRIDSQADLEAVALDTPEDDREEARRLIARGLSRLPLAEREVLTLFHLEELTLVEVAAALAVPVGTVKSRLFRARTMLRQKLTCEEKTP
jgi:RNA polymerase sigma-70 factor (ECF subfamily)